MTHDRDVHAARHGGGQVPEYRNSVPSGRQFHGELDPEPERRVFEQHSGMNFGPFVDAIARKAVVVAVANAIQCDQI